MSKSVIARHSHAYLLLGIYAILSFFYPLQAQAGQATLEWDPKIQSILLGGYELYYGQASGQASGTYTYSADVGNTTRHTLTGLLDGKKYYFAVKAYSIGGLIKSGFSNEVSTTIATPTTAPSASFVANATSLTVTFTDTSTGNITTWLWSFGDGTTSNVKNTAKTYTNPGTYPVALTVTGPGGSNTATKTVSVTAAAPVADFIATPVSGTAPLDVAFTNGSTGTVSGYSWTFGDGGTSTAQNPAYKYTNAGTYAVSLTANGPGGTNTKTRSGYITVYSNSGGGGGSNAGLVGAYNFEEASGTTVVDASGQGNTGTITGTTRITQGSFGKALSFDGVNDWITINDAASLDLTTGMTLESWVYPTVDMTDWATVILKEQANGTVYYLSANSDTSRPATGVSIGGEQQLRGGSWLLANQWAHLAATYDGTSQRLRLYVNGTEEASRVQSGAITVSNGVVRIGGNSIWGEFFQGRIDEVRIYNRPLSAGEIQSDMATSIATSNKPVTLVGTPTTLSVTDSLPEGTAQAFQVKAALTGWVTSLSVYLDGGSTATKVVAGLYANSSGHPSTLLAQGTLSSPGSGTWKSIPIPPARITAGTSYWIAIRSLSGTLKFRDRGGNAGSPSETSAQSSLTVLPSTWKTGKSYNEGPASAYGTGY